MSLSKIHIVDGIEMANVIYDTLMGNTQHEQFNHGSTDDQEINENVIKFTRNGLNYKLTVQCTE